MFVTQSQKNNMILIKQTKRPETIQRTLFSTLRTEEKSFFRVNKLLCVL